VGSSPTRPTEVGHPTWHLSCKYVEAGAEWLDLLTGRYPDWRAVGERVGLENTMVVV